MYLVFATERSRPAIRRQPHSVEVRGAVSRAKIGAGSFRRRHHRQAAPRTFRAGNGHRRRPLANAALASQIAAAAGAAVVDLTGQTNLRQLVALLERAELVIANDSGPMHIAAALLLAGGFGC